MAVNTQLFMEIRDAVLAEPQRFNMTYGFGMQSCGTTGCIAGWAWVLSRNMRHYKGSHSDSGYPGWQECGLEAYSLLGMDNSQESNGLFHFHLHYLHKDSQYRDLSLELRKLEVGSPEYAAVVVKAIDLYLTLKGFDVPKLVAEYHRSLGARIVPPKEAPRAAKAAAKPPQTVLESVIERTTTNGR